MAEERHETRTVVGEAGKRRLRIVATHTRTVDLDREGADRVIGDLESREAALVAELADVRARLADLAAKRDQVDAAPKEGGEPAQV